ncbi:hypothetical protein LTR53_007972 [Teratosphaeriaceae sp. CCFEE 6253]|nr:hypothetical protein LTR53_007972 [Teratosphaeriaceae sp. CCFEE 6253]
MALGKRKRAELEATAKLNTFATQLKADADKLSLFDLPAELRTGIYEYVSANTSDVYLSPRTKTLVPRSGLVLANKQVRSEFLAVQVFHPEITTTVTGFDFGHVITFMNKQAKFDHKTTPGLAKDGLSPQFIEIKLLPPRNVVMLWEREDADKVLDRWVSRISRPKKKGDNNIECSARYMLHESFARSSGASGGLEWMLSACRGLLDDLDYESDGVESEDEDWELEAQGTELRVILQALTSKA